MKETKLKAGEPSPFDAVCSNYEMYQKQDTFNRQCLQLKESYMNDLSQSTGDALSINWEGYVISFGFGTIAGIILKSYLDKK